MCHGGRCFQPLFLLVQCTLLTQASHLSSQSTLSTDDHLDRMHEYVVDDHGKTSLLANSALMRRENLVAEPGSKQLTSRLKSFLRRKIEERSRARRLLAEANSPYQPSCAKLPNFKLKGSTPMLYNAGNTVAACIAGCRPRQNVAKGKTASGSRNTRGNGPARALDGNAKTQFVSARMSDPYWQVDLGEERDVGEVYLSSSVTMAGVSVGLRDAACVEATTTTTTASTSTTSTTEASEDNSNDNSNSGQDSGNDEAGSSSNTISETQLWADEPADGEDIDAALLEELSDSNNIRALSPKKLGACDFKHTCGTISGSGKFVSCKGQSGRYLVIKKTGERQTLTVGEVEVWEDAVLSRTAAVATMSVAKKGESNGADRVLDDADNTATISQAGNNPWLQIELVDEGNVGKVTITPNAGARSAFAPTAAAPVKVGVSDKTCSNGEKGCSSSEKSVLCGTLTETKEAGSYIVDCGGKGGKFAWIELPGKSRAINIATVEVEQAALCEQVVFERPAKGAVKCYHFDEYSGVEDTKKVQGTKYTSAICHTAGKVGPAGVKGAKGDRGPAGNAGAPGKAGAKGEKGDAGAVGEPGEVGETGPEGQDADVAGFATMGMLGIAGGLCLVITIAILVILLNKVAPKKEAGGGTEQAPEEEGYEGEGWEEEQYPEETQQ